VGPIPADARETAVLSRSVSHDGMSETDSPATDAQEARRELETVTFQAYRRIVAI
jgi:hypothetical protein